MGTEPTRRAGGRSRSIDRPTCADRTEDIMSAEIPVAHDRRTFLKGGAALGATPAAAAAGTPTAMAKVARTFGPIDRDAVTPGDIAILKFLGAAELVEDDLWQQYCE